MKLIDLSKKEVAVVGAILLLDHEQFSESDFDSIFGIDTQTRSRSILVLKKALGEHMREGSPFDTITISETDSAVLHTILRHFYSADRLKRVGFSVDQNELECLINKFD